MAISDSQYLCAILPTLPTEVAFKIRTLCATPSNECLVESLIRLVSGGECIPDASKTLEKEWIEKQAATRQVLDSLVKPSFGTKKRPIDDIGEGGSSDSDSKRQRVSPMTDTPVFTLHSISVTSPIRKKVDISICKSSIRFINPSSATVESTIPISSILRAFLLPTRGKSKAHWTIVLLSSDSPDRSKSAAKDNPQIIFGLDAATTSPLKTTSYVAQGDKSESIPHTIPKGAATLPAIRDFLSNLPIALYEPSTNVFKSACNGIGQNASTSGIPGVEAYRSAKQGNLWFMEQGVLWGESKPCEFWSVKNFINKSDGVRVSGGGARVFSITLTRKIDAADEDGEEDIGEETEFGMIDAREREGINEWVKRHRHLFGKVDEVNAQLESPKQKGKGVQYIGPVTIHQLAAESDEEDEDFEDSSSDDGSGSGSKESSSEDGDNEDDGEGEAEGSDDDVDLDGSGPEDEEEMKPEHHPLMRPGAVPRMTRAARDMVIALVEGDMMGGEDESNSEMEEDELED